jgi:hypothetical protein
MIAFPLPVPIDPSFNLEFSFSSLVQLLRASLTEATIALRLYSEACEENEERANLMMGWDPTLRAHEETLSGDQLHALIAEIERDPGAYFEKMEREREKENLLLDRQLTMDRIIDKMPHDAMIMHARTFMYSVARIWQLLKRLAQSPTHKEVFEVALEKFEDAFPGIRENRNSSSHIDERLNTLTLSPEENGLRVFISESIAAHHYQNSTPNGSIVSLEISIDTLATIQEILCEALLLVGTIHRIQ